MDRSLQTPQLIWLICLLLTIGFAHADEKSRKSTSPTLSSLSPASGVQGQKITLTGNNFGTRKGKVYFGNTELTEKKIASWSNTRVVTTVPKLSLIHI